MVTVGTLLRAVWHSRRDAILASALAFFALAHGLIGLDQNPYLSVDEGWLLQVPRNLLALGLYGGVTLDGPVPFASELTTGPAVLLPATAAFALLGDGVATGRLISVLYSALATAAAPLASASPVVSAVRRLRA